MTEVSPRRVPEIAILTALGLCGRQPPRDVRRWIRQRRLFSWTVEARDVYATIARLENDGLVSIEVVRIDDVRQTRQYQLTASGLDVLSDLPAQILSRTLRLTAASGLTGNPRPGERVDRPPMQRIQALLEESLDLVALAALVADKQPGQVEIAFALRQCQRQHRSALDALGGNGRRVRHVRRCGGESRGRAPARGPPGADPERRAHERKRRDP
jgi:DNA-binding PadR family transcriptional regulator